MLYGIEIGQFFQGSLWSYILEVKAYHLEKLSCIVKIILHPINPLQVPNQTKLMIKSNVNLKKIQLVSTFDFCSAMKARASL